LNHEAIDHGFYILG